MYLPKTKEIAERRAGSDALSNDMAYIPEVIRRRTRSGEAAYFLITYLEESQADLLVVLFKEIEDPDFEKGRSANESVSVEQIINFDSYTHSWKPTIVEMCNL